MLIAKCLTQALGHGILHDHMGRERDLLREAMAMMGRVGARARAAKLSRARRKAIAKKAAQARWAKKRKKAR